MKHFQILLFSLFLSSASYAENKKQELTQNEKKLKKIIEYIEGGEAEKVYTYVTNPSITRQDIENRVDSIYRFLQGIYFYSQLAKQRVTEEYSNMLYTTFTSNYFEFEGGGDDEFDFLTSDDDSNNPFGHFSDFDDSSNPFSDFSSFDDSDDSSSDDNSSSKKTNEDGSYMFHYKVFPTLFQGSGGSSNDYRYRSKEYSLNAQGLYILIKIKIEKSILELSDLKIKFPSITDKKSLGIKGNNFLTRLDTLNFRTLIWNHYSTKDSLSAKGMLSSKEAKNIINAVVKNATIIDPLDFSYKRGNPTMKYIISFFENKPKDPYIDNLDNSPKHLYELMFSDHENIVLITTDQGFAICKVDDFKKTKEGLKEILSNYFSQN